MSRFISNTDPVGNDCCLSPLLFEAPVIIVDNGSDCFWYPATMDQMAADRLAFSLMHGLNVEAYRVNVKIILPSASQVRAATAELDRLKSHPVRAKLLAG